MESKFAYEMNAFSPFAEVKGRLDLAANLDSYAGIVDSTQATPLKPGDPVTIVKTSSGLPHFTKVTPGSLIMGFVKWSAKKQEYAKGEAVEVSYSNDVMYMEAGAAVPAGSAVSITDLENVYVGALDASKGSVIGYAMEQATAANELIRVRIAAPVAYTANADK